MIAGGLKVHQIQANSSTLTYSSSVTSHRSDLSAASLTHAIQAAKADVVISTVSGGSHETQKRFIDCAIGAGVTRFIPAEFGQDSLNLKVQERLPPSAERGLTIKYLEGLAAQGRISWVGLATGCLLDHGLISGNLGFDMQWRSATLHGTGKERFAASSVGWIGRVVASAVTHWDAVHDQYLYVSSMITSSNAILSSLEHVTGDKWEAGRADIEECVPESERRLARGFPDAGMFLMERSVLYDESLHTTETFIEMDAKPTLSLKGEDLEGLISRVVHDSKHHSKGGCDCA